ncbi:hypothetical protein CDAR_526512 [Caerostris darwini]|uniref:Uncharacterized protein n=2 Tax=Caerostris darwini TaxID=1538125 RepID=A0AAV4T0N7_9ARAC|nr:hypothetical protein CDAR_526512 [Caerostris darwini]
MNETMEAFRTAVLDAVDKFDSFLIIPEASILVSCILNAVKSLYVTIAIREQMISNSVALPALISWTVYYICKIKEEELSMLWPTLVVLWRFMNLFFVVFTVFCSDDVVILFLQMSLIHNYLIPFSFFVDVYVVICVVIDSLGAFYQNNWEWKGYFILTLFYFYSNLYLEKKNVLMIISHFFSEMVYLYVIRKSVSFRKSVPLYTLLLIIEYSGLYLGKPGEMKAGELVIIEKKLQFT